MTVRKLKSWKKPWKGLLGRPLCHGFFTDQFLLRAPRVWAPTWKGDKACDWLLRNNKKKGSRKLPTSLSSKPTLGSLSRDVFERRTSTGSGRFELLSRDFEQIFGQIVSIRITTLSNTNTVASRHIKRERGSLPVDVRRSKTSLLKLPNYHLLLT